MKKLILALALLPLLGFAKSSTPKGFTDNLDEAFQEARRTGKYIYVCFSGSDWCGWCMKLEKEVFSKNAFLKAVENDYVLVFIDSPRDQSCLSERAKVENPKLVESYSIHGFPTALVFDENGLKIATTGYQKGGAKKYAKMLLKMRNSEELKIEAEIQAKFIFPFEKKMEAVARNYEEKMGAYVEAEKAKGRIESDIENDFFKDEITIFPDMIRDFRREVENFEKTAVPPQAEELRNEKADEAKEIIDNMEKYFERKKAEASVKHSITIDHVE